MLWSSVEVANILKVKIEGVWFASGVSIDTRTLQPGDLFFALTSDKDDGHKYIDDALNKGAVACIASYNYRHPKNDNRVIYFSDSTSVAMNILAMGARKRCSGIVVGITGSVGKTTIKDMVGSVFTTKSVGFKSEANLNNTLGVPLNLLRMPPTTRFAVIEAGMNHVGELNQIGRVMQPDIGMITNIHPAHIANFPNLDAVAAAKFELMQHVKVGGTIILDGDGAYTQAQTDTYIDEHKGKVVTYGSNVESDVRLLSNSDFEDMQKIRILQKGDVQEYQLKAFGYNNAKNIVGALAVCQVAGFKAKEVMEVLSKWEPLVGRGKVYRYKLPKSKKIIIFDESYNSSPASLESALINLARYPVKGRKIAYIADMLELGQYEKNYHAMIKDVVMREEIPYVVTVGPLMGYAMQTLPPSKILGTYRNVDDCIQDLPHLLNPDDIIMIKGSHSMRMHEVVETIRQALE